MNISVAIIAFSVIWLLFHILLQAFLATREKGLRWNFGARDEVGKPLSTLAGRAERASKNFAETYPAFLALMLYADITAINNGALQAGALLWMIARVIYLPLYLGGVPFWRTLIWLISIIGLLVMFFALWY